MLPEAGLTELRSDEQQLRVHQKMLAVPRTDRADRSFDRQSRGFTHGATRDEVFAMSALRPMERSTRRGAQWPDLVTIRDEF